MVEIVFRKRMNFMKFCINLYILINFVIYIILINVVFRLILVYRVFLNLVLNWMNFWNSLYNWLSRFSFLSVLFSFGKGLYIMLKSLEIDISVLRFESYSLYFCWNFCRLVIVFVGGVLGVLGFWESKAFLNFIIFITKVLTFLLSFCSKVFRRFFRRFSRIWFVKFISFIYLSRSWFIFFILFFGSFSLNFL